MVLTTAPEIRQYVICSPFYNVQPNEYPIIAKEILSNYSPNEKKRHHAGLMMLYFAAQRGNVTLAEMLLTNGIDPNSKDAYFGEMPLHTAAYNNKPEMVEFLMLNGAEINALDDKNKNPLFYAAWEGHDNIWKMLVDSGSEIDLENEKNAYRTGYIYQLVADHFESKNNSNRAIEYYKIANEYFKKSTLEFNELASEYRGKKTIADITSILAVVLVNELSRQKAIYDAKRMASISPRGKGYGYAEIYHYQANTSDLGQLADHFSELATRSEEAAKQCQQILKDYEK